MAASMLTSTGMVIEAAGNQRLSLGMDAATGLAASMICELARADIGLFVVLHKTMMGYVLMHGPPDTVETTCECEPRRMAPAA